MPRRRLHFSRHFHPINKPNPARWKAIMAAAACTDTAGQEGPLQALRSSNLLLAVTRTGELAFSLRFLVRLFSCLKPGKGDHFWTPLQKLYSLLSGCLLRAESGRFNVTNSFEGLICQRVRFGYIQAHGR